MRAEDIIEALNRHIEEKRKSNNISTKGHLVLLRTIITNPTFKIYKTYQSILWFVKNRKNYKVLTMEYVAKVADGQEDKVQKEVNIELCNSIFNWIGSDYYNQVINGEFKGIKE